MPALGSLAGHDAAISRPHEVTRPQALVLRPALATLRLLGWGLGVGDPTPPPGAQALPQGSPLAVLVLTCPGCQPSLSRHVVSLCPQEAPVPAPADTRPPCCRLLETSLNAWEFQKSTV